MRRRTRPSSIEFESILEHASMGIAVLDLEGRITYTNSKVSELVGLDDPLIGRSIADLDFLEEDNVGELFEVFSRAVKDGTDRELEMMTSFKGRGPERWARFRTSILKDRRGAPHGLVVFVTDITDQKRAEKELMEREEKYRAAVEQSAENIYIYDVVTHKIVETNHALQELLGYSADEMKVLKASDFIAHSDLDIEEKIQNVLSKGSAIVGERRYMRKNGSLVDVEVSASRLTSGERTLLCVVSRDITERKMAHERLIMERNRAEFYLDLLAHDIGNLHHGILAAIDLFKMSKGRPDREAKYIDMIEQLVGRSIRLVNNVMILTRIKSSPLKMERLEVKDLLEKALKNAMASFPEKKVESTFELDDGPHIVKAEHLLEEAFFNIYHNSVKFGSDGSALIVTTVRNEEGVVTISVSDNGPGIHPDDKTSIFERFNEISKKKHTGLGMSLIKAMVDRYGGKVWVEDRIMGDYKQGAKVVVELPRASSEP